MAGASFSTILVTGANGFVGRHALLALRARFPGARLVSAVQHEGAHCLATDATIAFDLSDPIRVEAAIRDIVPDAVLHLAARADIAASFANPIGVWQVNLMGTLALAEAVLRHVPHAAFVHASSAECYGLSFRAGTALDEHAPFAPANPYAASKAAADLALGEMALRGLKIIRLRPFNQAGPGQTEAFVVSAFARQVARIEAGVQEPVIRTGALDRWRDMIDVRDACVGYAAALSQMEVLEPGTAINLASGQSRRVGDILEELIALAGIRVRVETDPGQLRPTDIERTQGDASLAKRLLCWSPAIPWKQTLADVFSDWRNQVPRPSL